MWIGYGISGERTFPCFAGSPSLVRPLLNFQEEITFREGAGLAGDDRLSDRNHRILVGSFLQPVAGTGRGCSGLFRSAPGLFGLFPRSVRSVLARDWFAF